MRSPRCPHCSSTVFFESLVCPNCGTEIAFHALTEAFVLAPVSGILIDGERWWRCSNRGWRCNWLAADGQPSGRCLSCRLTRRQPENDDLSALDKLADVDVDKRRLLVQLLDLDLPITPYYEHAGGLAFDLISSRSGEPVTIGHANGVITIDLVESLDDYRENLRVRLGEVYRTMLGHFRHEVGHYYQNILLADETGALWDECRALFGDERTSYQDAIARHYKTGAPEGWASEYISDYATMHPWEDFAECFAHYLHITGTLATAADSGVVLQADRVDGLITADVLPREDYREASIEEILSDWHWLSLMFNRINRSMGLGDLYPFDIVPPVAAKLAFVHRIVTRERA